MDLQDVVDDLYKERPVAEVHQPQYVVGPARIAPWRQVVIDDVDWNQQQKEPGQYTVDGVHRRPRTFLCDNTTTKGKDNGTV